MGSASASSVSDAMMTLEDNENIAIQLLTHSGRTNSTQRVVYGADTYKHAFGMLQLIVMHIYLFVITTIV